MALAVWLGLLRRSGADYLLTSRAIRIYHDLEQLYTTAYIDKTWSIARQEASPGVSPCPEVSILGLLRPPAPGAPASQIAKKPADQDQDQADPSNNCQLPVGPIGQSEQGRLWLLVAIRCRDGSFLRAGVLAGRSGIERLFLVRTGGLILDRKGRCQAELAGFLCASLQQGTAVDDEVTLRIVALDAQEAQKSAPGHPP
ncbi:MAG: hypothetical protein LRY35_04870 [Clostridiales bacterium]|nr:hypothetical protein [Clostridiales bacterium]